MAVGQQGRVQAFHSLSDQFGRSKRLAMDISNILDRRGVRDYLYLRNKPGDLFNQDITRSIMEAKVFILYVDLKYGSTGGTLNEIEQIQAIVNSRRKSHPGMESRFVILMEQLPYDLHTVPVTVGLMSGVHYVHASQGARALANQIIERIRLNEKTSHPGQDYSIQEVKKLLKDIRQNNSNGRISWTTISKSKYWTTRCRSSSGLKKCFNDLKDNLQPNFVLTDVEKQYLRRRGLL